MDGQSFLQGAVLDGKYELSELIGQGGMGAVFRARHLGTQRAVAVKVLLSSLVASPEAAERFRREARAAGGLRHPNVVDVTDFGVATVDGREVAYLAMEHLEGSSLRDLIDQRGALPVEVVLDVIEQIAAALEAAHAAGIVHRDLKPENVWLVNDGRGGFTVRVLDFGIALLDTGSSVEAAPGVPAAAAAVAEPFDFAGEENATGLYLPHVAELEGGTPRVCGSDSDSYRLTGVGALVGTPSYMSPEQFRGDAVTKLSDLYALGILAWECIAGVRPFRGELRQVMHGHLYESPPAIPRVRAEVSDVLLRAMAKAPGDRFPSANAFAGSLRAAAEGSSTLLRHCLALYANRWSEMRALAWRCGRTPFLASMAGVALAAYLLLAFPFDKDRAATILTVSALWCICCWASVTMFCNACFALAIQRLRQRPLERLDPDDIGRELRTRIGLEPDAGSLRTGANLLSFYIRRELRAPAGKGDLAFLIGLLEQRSLQESNERCLELVAGARRFHRPVALGIFAGMLLLPALEASVLLHLAGPFGTAARCCALGFAMGLMPLNAVLVNPLFSSALTLMYYRSRQARGEAVPVAAVIPGRL